MAFQRIPEMKRAKGISLGVKGGLEECLEISVSFSISGRSMGLYGSSMGFEAFQRHSEQFYHGEIRAGY